MARDPARELVPPRRHLVDPAGFGQASDQEWIQPVTATAFMGMRAAEVQHHIAITLQRAIAISFLGSEPLPLVSRELGFEEQRLARLLRGHYRMGLRDLQAFEGAFGPILVRLQFERVVIEDEGLRRRFQADPTRLHWQG